jgi:DNA-binding transcriptional MerR regulator
MLRAYEDMGLIYTAGRSAGNYRLFDTEALWCVAVVGGLRSLGLTLAELKEVTAIYLTQPGDPIGRRIAVLLAAVRARTAGRIAELEQLLGRIDAFEAEHVAELAGRADFRAQDPRFAYKGLDSPPGGRP